MLLKLGASGNEVRLIQLFLKKIGYPIKSTNGEFSAETQKYIIQYQKLKGLLADGEIGTKTIESLLKDSFSFSEERGATVDRSLTNEFIKNLLKRAQEFEGLVEIKPNSEWDDPDIKGIQKEQSLKFKIKRDSNPDNYNDINTNQLKYWLNLGYSEDESKRKIIERQRN